MKIDYQRKGLAKKMIKYIEKDVAGRGFDGIHFLAAKTNHQHYLYMINLDTVFAENALCMVSNGFAMKKSSEFINDYKKICTSKSF